MTISTLFLDIGQVLVGLDYEAVLARIQTLTPLSPQEVKQRLADSPDLLLYEKGHISTLNFFRHLLDLLKMDISLDLFEKTWVSVFVLETDHGRELISPEFFRRLKAKYSVIALSNINQLHFEYLSQFHPLVNEFDEYVLSYQVGSVKPDPPIYHAALEKTNSNPQEVLFVDDRIENIEAAEKLGMGGILFVGEAQLEENLTDLGAL